MHGHWEFTKKMTERDRNDRQLNNVREQRESATQNITWRRLGTCSFEFYFWRLRVVSINGSER
jgi:hypothetical protein